MLSSESIRHKDYSRTKTMVTPLRQRRLFSDACAKVGTQDSSGIARSLNLLLIRQRFNDPARIACRHHIVGYIFGNNTTCSYYRPVADCNTRANNSTTANLYVFSNNNRFTLL